MQGLRADLHWLVIAYNLKASIRLTLFSLRQQDTHDLLCFVLRFTSEKRRILRQGFAWERSALQLGRQSRPTPKCNVRKNLVLEIKALPQRSCFFVIQSFVD